MKLAFFNDYQLGVIKGDRIIDAGSAVDGISYHTPQELMKMLIEDFSDLEPEIESAVAGGRRRVTCGRASQSAATATWPIGLPRRKLH